MTPKPNENKHLGPDTPIERRDLLNSTLLAAGSALLGTMTHLQLLAREDWTGYGGIGDYASSNGNTYEVVTAGHQIRDRVFDPESRQPVNTGEHYDCVIVGGGISGPRMSPIFRQRDGG